MRIVKSSTLVLVILGVLAGRFAGAVTITVDAKASGMFGDVTSLGPDAGALDMVVGVVFSGPASVGIAATGLIDLNPTNPLLQNVSPDGLPPELRSTLLGASDRYTPLEEVIVDAAGIGALPLVISDPGALMGAFVPEATVNSSGFRAKDEDFIPSTLGFDVGISSSALFLIGSGPFTFSASEAGTLFLGINDPLAQNNTGSWAVNIVPEPTTLALLGLGLVGTGFTRRKKKH